MYDGLRAGSAVPLSQATGTGGLCLPSGIVHFRDPGFLAVKLQVSVHQRFRVSLPAHLGEVWADPGGLASGEEGWAHLQVATATSYFFPTRLQAGRQQRASVLTLQAPRPDPRQGNRL